MSASDEIKWAIVQYFQSHQIASNEKDWKRVSKVGIHNRNVREFHNAKLGRSVYTIGDDEDCSIAEKDQWIYGANTTEDGEYYFVLESEDRFMREGRVYDQHQAEIAEVLFNLPRDVVDNEDMENCFLVDGTNYNSLTIHILLKKHGLVHSPALTNFLKDPSLPVATRPGIPPVNPPTPIGLNKAGPAIPTVPVVPGVPLDLQNQQPAVQKMLLDARARGELGLDQVNGRWLDLEDIEAQSNRGYYCNVHNGVIELERSHVLWLLYEHYDRNSGLAYPDFFAMANEQLYDEIHKIIDLDDNYDDVIEIIDDLQSYPAPYDLPVPVYVPPPPVQQPNPLSNLPGSPQASAGPKPAPMRTPPGITGSGSFAALPTAPVAQEEEEDHSQANFMKHDAGEQPVEFYEEVWEFFKANGASEIGWYDRFRPRFAKISGLGYKFDRVEFTGIRVRMGYLNDKGELIDNIEIPDVVFDDLFTNGGEWNDDDNIQFINKQPGIDPETGFSYSSQNMWADIEQMLIAQGWNEAK